MSAAPPFQPPLRDAVGRAVFRPRPWRTSRRPSPRRAPAPWRDPLRGRGRAREPALCTSTSARERAVQVFGCSACGTPRRTTACSSTFSWPTATSRSSPTGASTPRCRPRNGSRSAAAWRRRSRKASRAGRARGDRGGFAAARAILSAEARRPERLTRQAGDSLEEVRMKAFVIAVLAATTRNFSQCGYARRNNKRKWSGTAGTSTGIDGSLRFSPRRAVLALAPFMGFPRQATARSAARQAGRSRASATEVWTYNGAVRARAALQAGRAAEARSGERARRGPYGALARHPPAARRGRGAGPDPGTHPCERGKFVYEFDLPDAGTYWYHPHLGEGEQLGRGLFGALVVEERHRRRSTANVVDALGLAARSRGAHPAGFRQRHGRESRRPDRQHRDAQRRHPGVLPCACGRARQAQIDQRVERAHLRR